MIIMIVLCVDNRWSRSSARTCRLLSLPSFEHSLLLGFTSLFSKCILHEPLDLFFSLSIGFQLPSFSSGRFSHLGLLLFGLLCENFMTLGFFSLTSCDLVSESFRFLLHCSFTIGSSTLFALPRFFPSSLFAILSIFFALLAFLLLSLLLGKLEADIARAIISISTLVVREYSSRDRTR